MFCQIDELYLLVLWARTGLIKLFNGPPGCQQVSPLNSDPSQLVSTVHQHVTSLQGGIHGGSQYCYCMLCMHNYLHVLSMRHHKVTRRYNFCLYKTPRFDAVHTKQSRTIHCDKQVKQRQFNACLLNTSRCTCIR